MDLRLSCLFRPLHPIGPFLGGQCAPISPFRLRFRPLLASCLFQRPFVPVILVPSFGGKMISPGRYIYT